MNQKSKTIDRCQISGVKDLKSILSLGYLPAVNKLKKINSSLQDDTFFPTELVFSPSSKLVQLNTLVNINRIFEPLLRPGFIYWLVVQPELPPRAAYLLRECLLLE